MSRLHAPACVLLVIDMQVPHLTQLQTADANALTAIIDGLRLAATYHAVSLIVTAAELHGERAPLAGTLANAPVIWRSTADPLAAPAIVAAIEATHRRTLVIAGVATDIGVTLAALSAKTNGYRPIVVLDACGANSARAEAAAVARLANAGIEVTSAGAVLSEWQEDFDAPHGRETLQLIGAQIAR